MPQTLECLYTTIKNVSGGEKAFSFLPPHGRRLANNAEITEIGGLSEIVRRPGGFVASKRHIAGLQAALLAGDIEVINTPTPVLYDGTKDETRQLKLDNSILYAADPCWLSTSASSSLGTPGALE